MSGQPDLSLALRIALMSAASPLAPALRCGQLVLDYAGFAARAGELADHLERHGIGRGAVVAVCLDRCFDQIASILAIMAIGAAFLPLDPAWPDNYIGRLLEDSGAAAVIGSAERLTPLSGRCKVLESDCEFLPSTGILGRVIADVADEDLAYIIYTSGSTGTPKGVEISHGNLRNLIAWHHDAFGISAADRVSHAAGLGFDAAIWEVWPALAAGACVELVPEPCRRSARTLQDWLVQRAITVAFVPTVLAASMIVASWPERTALRLLLTGGDALQVRPRPGLPFEVVNNYGPTECTVVATSGTVAPAPHDVSTPPIGRPIANVDIEILDPDGVAVAPGEVGEMLVCGAGVGRGYRNRPELTAERFVRASGDRPAYRTGDLGRVLPDGRIAFCGRIDAQEKIRGHRVEPDEIVRALNRHPTVAASAVQGRGTPPDRSLTAYVVAAEGTVPTIPDLRAHLASLLPDYMTPASFVAIAWLPVTSSGKLDRLALPEPSPANALAATPYRVAATPTEGRVAAIMADLLHLEHVGADDDFFLLGGHSLLATQVVLRCREAFDIDLKLLQLFDAKTIANLAVVIEDLLIARLETMSEDDAQLLLKD